MALSSYRVIDAISPEKLSTKVLAAVLAGEEPLGAPFLAADGNRLLDLTDGTTIWTTIANADLESAPAASLVWGNTKVPLLTGKSNVASTDGDPVYFAYSGGTTDHTTGSITFSVCLERLVAP